MLSPSLITISNARPLDSSQSSPPSHGAINREALFTIIIIIPTCAIQRTARAAAAATPANFRFFFFFCLLFSPARCQTVCVNFLCVDSSRSSLMYLQNAETSRSAKAESSPAVTPAACPDASKPSRSTSSRTRIPH